MTGSTKVLALGNQLVLMIILLLEKDRAEHGQIKAHVTLGEDLNAEMLDVDYRKGSAANSRDLAPVDLEVHANFCILVRLQTSLREALVTWQGLMQAWQNLLSTWLWREKKGLEMSFPRAGTCGVGAGRIKICWTRILGE